MQGYEPEEHELQAVLDSLVGDREGEDPLWWYTHLSARQTLLAAAEARIADQRARVAVEIYQDYGSYERLAQRLGTSRSRAQQLVERGRELHATRSREQA